MKIWSRLVSYIRSCASTRCVARIAAVGIAVSMLVQPLPATAQETDNPPAPSAPSSQPSATQSESTQTEEHENHENTGRTPAAESPSTTEPRTETSGESADEPKADHAQAPLNGWVTEQGKRYWFDHGVMARSKEVFDPGSKAWYWIDADGTMARNKDVYLRSGRKWVRYDSNGHMVKGEDCRYGAWYDFDPVTGAMRYGFVYHDAGQKWVFYDRVTGRMAKGQQPIDGHWYYLDPVTGAVAYGWQHVKSGNTAKWVLYDWPSGHMRYGSVTDAAGNRYYLNPFTGAYDAGRSPSRLPSRALRGVSIASFGNRVRNGSYRSVRMLGDSIAAGVGADGGFYTNNTPLFELDGETHHEPAHQVNSAVNRLRSALASHGATMVNASVPGKGCMTNYLRVAPATLGGENAAIVMLGTNDRIYAPSLSQFSANAESYLRTVARHYHGNLYVISEPPAANEPYHFTTGQVDGVLRSICARNGWEFLSLYTAFNQLSIAEGVPLQALLKDGLHPNRMGQDVMWEALRQMLNL